MSSLPGRMAQTNNLNFVRIVAASLVVISHSWDLLKQPSPVWFDVNMGAFAVRIFFVVSGYLVCDSWSRDPNFFRFIARRALRIIPGLAAVVILTALILGPLVTSLPTRDYFEGPEFRTYLWNVALWTTYALPGVFNANPFKGAVNGSLWTLSSEFMCYLVLPLYGAAGSRLCRHVLMPAALIVVGAAGLYYQLRPELSGPLVWNTGIPLALRWAPYFVAGAAFRVWRLERFLDMHIAIISLGICAILFGNESTRHLSLMVAIPYVVLTFGLIPSPYLPRFGRRADISYGVYLYAFPIQQTIIAKAGPGLHPLILMATALPLSWLCGWLSWHLVEKHALRLKPRRTSKLSGTGPRARLREESGEEALPLAK